MKSLDVAIASRGLKKEFDAQKFGHIVEIRDCCDIIKNNFPMNSEVVIADVSIISIQPFKYYLTNLIEKKEGEDPKIVYGLSPDSQSWFSRIADLFTRFY